METSNVSSQETTGLRRVTQNSDWSDVTPLQRYGKTYRNQVQPPPANTCHVICVSFDPVKLKDVATLKWMSQNDLPSTYAKHEVYSICLSKTVNQGILQSEENSSERFLFLDDHSHWTEPQVKAIVLLMHAVLLPGEMSQISSESKEVEAAEALAEHYCRSMGIDRVELAKFHSTSSSSRITRTVVEDIKNQEPTRHYCGRQSNTVAASQLLDRQDSQTPLRLLPQHFEVKEHGGVEGTVFKTLDEDNKIVDTPNTPESVVQSPPLVEDTPKVPETKAKTKSTKLSPLKMAKRLIKAQKHEQQQPVAGTA